MILLKFIFFIFLAAFVGVLLVAYSFYRQVKNVTGRFRQRQDQQTKVNGNVIIDRRSPDKVGRKIIADDEGEYVEYEEN